MTKDEALRMAIEVFDMYGNKMNSAFADEAYQACKDALAETQEPVPIAILHRKRLEVYNPKLTVHEKADVTFLNVDETDRESNMRYQSLADGDYKLYTALPNREWVGLSDEERYLNEGRSPEEIEYARAIEAKLREKNNGT